MKLSEYVQYDATGLASLVNAGEVTALELARLAREAYDEVNPRINAVIEFYEDAETVPGADAGLFNGVPFLRKDSGATEAGRLQEKGSRLFKGYRPNTESFFFRRARNAGLRTLGRTTTPELANSVMSESILNGTTGNPWDLQRAAGALQRVPPQQWPPESHPLHMAATAAGQFASRRAGAALSG